MNSGGRVSVIIPTYNNAATIASTIETIQEQSYQDLDIIIVNDGSTDHTTQVVEKLAASDSRILLVNQSNQGPSEARNRGLAEANGDFVMFVDADDVLEPEAIQHMVTTMLEHRAELVIAGIRRVMIDAGGRRSATDNIDILQEYQGSQTITDCFFQLLEQNDVINSMCAKLYRRDIIREHSIAGNAKLDMGEDLQFNLSYMTQIDTFYLLPEVVYEYKKYNSVLTNRYRENLFEARKESVRLLRLFLDEKRLPHNLTHYLYLKLIVSQAMQDHLYHKPKAERLAHIESALKNHEVREALEEFQPEGKMQRLIAHATKGGKPTRIDVYARWITLGRKLFGNRIKRVSV